MSKSRGKAHYEKVAAIIRERFDPCHEWALHAHGQVDGIFEVEHLGHALADLYESEDPDFDKARFLEAALAVPVKPAQAHP